MFSAPLPRTDVPVVCLPLIFSAGGAELRSNLAPQTAHYFARLERVKLVEALEKYRAHFPVSDHAAVPVVAINPLLPEGLPRPAAPLSATLTVAETGLVTHVAIDSAVNTALQSVLVETLSGWLFLPRLVGGRPVSSRVQVPLKF